MDTVRRIDDLPSNPDKTAILRSAAERRNPTAVAVSGKSPRISKNGGFDAWDAGHDARQEFRRMLDPGILRNNDKKDAVMSLKVKERKKLVTERPLFWS